MHKSIEFLIEASREMIIKNGCNCRPDENGLECEYANITRDLRAAIKNIGPVHFRSEDKSEGGLLIGKLVICKSTSNIDDFNSTLDIWETTCRACIKTKRFKREVFRKIGGVPSL